MITFATCGGVLVTVLALLALVDQFARNYAKRQYTWFRHQRLGELMTVDDALKSETIGNLADRLAC